MDDNYSLKNENSLDNSDYNKKFESNSDYNQKKYQMSPLIQKREISNLHQNNQIQNSHNNYKKKLYLIDKNSDHNDDLNIENMPNNNFSKQIVNDFDEENLHHQLTTDKRMPTQEENVPLFKNKSQTTHASNNSNNINHNINYQQSNIDSNNLQLFEKYQNLNQKYNSLKEKFKDRCEVSEYWRRNYFNLLKDSLMYEETILQLTEENRIHLEYIISLENKINKILQVSNNITNNFHQNLMNFMKQDNFNNLNVNTTNMVTYNNNNDLNQSNLNNNKNSGLNNAFVKNFTETLNDYKKQLEILAEEKETLSTNLSISRHQQLQTNMKIEELQSRVVNLEKSRYQDLKFLENEQN